MVLAINMACVVVCFDNAVCLQFQNKLETPNIFVESVIYLLYS